MSAIAKGLRGVFKKRRNDDDQYMLENPIWHRVLGIDCNSADNDASSVRSYSTTSTVDDNPGTGRLVDKYLYQKGGRKMERLIFWVRIRLPNVHPVLILRTLSKDFTTYCFFRTPTMSLSATMCDLTSSPNLISGLQNLVRQTQSTSIGRSALALSILITSSVGQHRYADFFVGVSKVEPIFHLESVAMTLDDSRPEKRFTLLLVKLAKANVIALDPRPPSSKLAQDVRDGLLRLLEARRDSLETISEASFIYANAISCMQLVFCGGVVSVHIAETIYFLTILLLRSIYDLHSQVYSFDLRIQRHISIVLSVLTRWLDDTLTRCIHTCSYLGPANTALPEIGSSFYGLFAAISTINPSARRSFPHVYDIIRHSRHRHSYVVPRRVQNTLGQSEIWMPINALVRRYEQRSLRLLASFDEVYWEIWDSTLRCRHSVAEMEEIMEDQPEGWEHEAKRTLLRARQANVDEDELTTDSSESGFWENGPVDDELLKSWYYYKILSHDRNTCAPYFCSNLDWDWDVAGSLRRLYKIENHSLLANRRSPSTDIAVDGTTWNITAKDSWNDLPADVRITFTTETGKIQHMTFTRDVKSPEVSTGARTLVSDHDDNPGEPDFVDSTQIDLLASSDTLSYEMDGVVGHVATTALERTPSDNGSSLIVQECDSRSWSAQYIDDRPALSSGVEPLENEAFIEELAGEAEGETTIFEMSAELTQVPTKGEDPESAFAQHINFASGTTENPASIEELDGEKDGDEDTAASEISDESTQIPADEIESASSFAEQIRVAAVERNGMKWFQIVGIVCASILLERFILAMLGHFFGKGGSKV